MSVGARVLQWWSPSPGYASSKTTGWYDLGIRTIDDGASLVQLLGHSYGEGRYLVIFNNNTWHEITVVGKTTWEQKA